MARISMLKAGSEYSPKKGSARAKAWAIINRVVGWSKGYGAFLSLDDFKAKGGTAFDLRFFESKGYVKVN